MIEPAQLEALAEAEASLRQATQEARQAIKDLRRERREAEQAIAGMMRQEIGARIDAEVRRQVELLGRETQDAMRRSVAKVGREFDRLARLYLEGDTKGEPSLPEMMEARRVLGLGPPGIPAKMRDQPGYEVRRKGKR